MIPWRTRWAWYIVCGKEAFFTAGPHGIGGSTVPGCGRSRESCVSRALGLGCLCLRMPRKVVGIIDYMRQYDIIKRMERMGKSVSMIAGQAEPTIVQPSQYKARFQQVRRVSWQWSPEWPEKASRIPEECGFDVFLIYESRGRGIRHIPCMLLYSPW